MEHTGKYLVVAAVFSYVVTFTSAVAVTATACTSGGTECDGITHSSCDTTLGSPMCKCDATYEEGTGGADNTCVAQDLTTITCTANGNECNVVSNSVCVSTKCACSTAYQQGTAADINKCVAKDLTTITCTANGNECNAVSNSVCVSTKCACSTAYKQGTGTDINKCLVRGLTETCTADNECSGVSNAACIDDAGNKKCTCKTDYKTENGMCNAANGLQTLLSAPVALLLSFLTIVFTRLH